MQHVSSLSSAHCPPKENQRRNAHMQARKRLPRVEGELNQEGGMEDLQIRRRRIGRGRIAQAWQKLNIASRQRDPLDRGDDRQIEMEVNSLLMIEGDLVAIAARAVFDRSFRFAMPIRTAAALRLRSEEH